MRKKYGKTGMSLILVIVMILTAVPDMVVSRAAEAALEDVTLMYSTESGKEIYGNITLPEKSSDGTAIRWSTDHPEIIDVNSHGNEGYDDTPAGVVTRPAADTDVKLTAEILSNGETVTKEFTVTVKAAPKPIREEDYTDYFFAYFTGEGLANGEQIYFASSEDGLKWTGLNGGRPSLTSTLGDKGVRDPYIIRSPEGDKFYIIATDLKIYGNGDWGAAQRAGSQCLMVWESTDLVNWGSQRMVKVSDSIEAGCTWAPEATYDVRTGEYIVYWASKVKKDAYGKQRLYYAKTRDFYTFTEPKVYMDLDQSTIDTTMINHNGTYYRYSKNEGGADNQYGAHSKTVFIEKSDGVLGEFTHIESDSLNSNEGVEGPTIFKLNKDDAETDTWCLLVDNYGSGGYYPLITTDLGSGVFTKPKAGTYKMPKNARHGTPIRVTREEYRRIMGISDEGQPTEVPTATPETTLPPIATKEPVTPENSAAGSSAVPTGETPVSESPVILMAQQSKVSKTSITVRWNKVQGAEGYLVYSALQGRKGKAPVNVKGKSSCTLKKLKKGKYYRIKVSAYKTAGGKTADGKRKILATAPDIFITTNGGKYANPVKIKAASAFLSGRVSKTVSANAKLVKKGKRKVKKCAAAIRYLSTDEAVAAVTKKGGIKGMAAGTCYVYCYAQNGVYKKVKVSIQ